MGVFNDTEEVDNKETQRGPRGIDGPKGDPGPPVRNVIKVYLVPKVTKDPLAQRVIEGR